MFASLHLIWFGGKVMAKGWVKRWGARGTGHRPSHIPALEVHPTTIIEESWDLPPSKSHMIRMMLLCALSKKKHTLIGFTHIGEDAESMRRCLSQLGIEFIELEHGIQIIGKGIEEFQRSPSVLHAGNSGTALRFLIGLASRLNFVSMVDGDATLRNRNHSNLLNALSPLDVQFSYGVEQERLPILIHGPWKGTELVVDVSSSSQPYSSLLLASSGLGHECVITTQGDAVSRRHSELTIELMKESGASLDIGKDSTTIAPWTSSPPTEWVVPPDGSMMAFPILACVLTKKAIHIQNPVDSNDALGHELLFQHLDAFGMRFDNSTLNPDGECKRIDINLR
ncbi:MAG: hypothetical protein ACO3NJ_03585, partial [Candidatus Poseidoniaceae archaeon]